VERASEHVVPQLVNLLALLQQLLARQVSFPATALAVSKQKNKTKDKIMRI
jgi:hypothetical protein